MSVVIRLLRRLARPRPGERGQSLFLFVGVVAVFFALGTVGVDAALWHSQRRIAQKDADAAAFAGGQALYNRSDPNMTSNAIAAAYEWGRRNGIDNTYFVNGSPKVISNCWGAPSFDGKPDGLVVDLSAKGASLFSAIWNAIAPDVGAHAKVCIGSPPDSEGVLPFGVQIFPPTAVATDTPQPTNTPRNSPTATPPGAATPTPTSTPVSAVSCFDQSGNPLFGQTCSVVVRAPDGSSGETGTLRLFTAATGTPPAIDCSASNVGSTNKYFVDEVAYGANTICGDDPPNQNPANCQMYGVASGAGTCVWSLTGNKAGVLIDGLQLRLSMEGQPAPPTPSPSAYDCDALFGDTDFGTQYYHDAIDQWWEALQSPNVDLHNVTPGPDVVFEKRQCNSPRVVTLILLQNYNQQGQGPYIIQGFAGFFIEGCYDDDGDYNQRCVTQNSKYPNPTGEPLLSNQGHIFMQGMFINFVTLGRHGGPINRYGRIFLFLVE